MAGIPYWIWLTECTGLRHREIHRLLAALGSPMRIFFAGAGELEEAGVPRQRVADMPPRDLGDAMRILRDCQEQGISVMTREDSAYPDRLRNIFDPPCVLYYRGILPPVDQETVVAVVGTRSCTPYGSRMAENLGYALAHGGAVVVSGLAKGVDAAAARGALQGGGRVIGVSGAGLDICYPPESAALYGDVAGQGVILSEYPPGSKPLREHFPARNRILSGLSLGVVVVEAGIKSGALGTAAYALEQGRDVFAVPGNADAACSLGANRLLKEGAIPVTEGNDILSQYLEQNPGRLRLTEEKRELRTEPQPEPTAETAQVPPAADTAAVDKEPEGAYTPLPEIPLEGDQRAVALAVTRPETPLDDVIVGSGLSAARALAALTMLELRNLVSRSGGKRYTMKVSVK